jgi:hypothetical protein
MAIYCPLTFTGLVICITLSDISFQLPKELFILPNLLSPHLKSQILPTHRMLFLHSMLTSLWLLYFPVSPCIVVHIFYVFTSIPRSQSLSFHAQSLFYNFHQFSRQHLILVLAFPSDLQSPQILFSWLTVSSRLNLCVNFHFL